MSGKAKRRASSPASWLSKLTAGGGTAAVAAAALWANEHLASIKDLDRVEQRMQVIEHRLDVWLESERRKYE